MARQDNDSNPISLFSFQDIITAITGIMFLVVLLMIILFMQNYLQRTPTQPATSAALQQEVSRLQQQLQKLQHEQDRFEQSLTELQQFSPEALQQHKQLLQQQIQIQRQQLQHNSRLLDQLQLQLQNMHENFLMNQQSVQQQQTALLQLQQQKILLEQIWQQTRQNCQQQQKLIKYTFKNTNNKTPILLQLDHAGLQILKLDDRQYIDFRTPHAGDFSRLSERFTSWLRNCSPHLYYFTVAVNPSGFTHAADVLDLLKKHHFERGVEILPDDQSVIMEPPAL